MNSSWKYTVLFFLIFGGAGCNNSLPVDADGDVEENPLTNRMRRSKKPETALKPEKALKGVTATASKMGPIRVGEKLPDFTRPANNGQRVSLNRLLQPPRQPASDAIVISFFTTYCKPCRESLPILQRLLREGSGRTHRGLLVAVREPSPVVTPWLASLGVDVQSISDTAGVLSTLYGVDGGSVPKTIVADRNGIVTTIFTTEGADFESALRNAINMASKTP